MRIKMSGGGVANVPTSGGTKTIRHNQILEISVADWNALESGMRAIFDIVTPPAELVEFTPGGSIAAINVQAALAELDAEKASAASVGIPPKHARVTTGALAGGASANVVVAWPTAFADDNYTANVDVLHAGGLIRHRLLARVAASITVRVTNEDSLNAQTGTIHAIAIHD